MRKDSCPEIRADAETFDMYVEGELAQYKPLDRIALGHRHRLR